MQQLSEKRQAVRAWHRADEAVVLKQLVSEAAISGETRAAMSRRAEELIIALRRDGRPGLMESFLEEYGLSTQEGVALMCLAEALLRVPDADTIDALIEDKIAPSSWGEHLGRSSSSLVNASTWALMLTGRVLDDDDSRGIAKVLHGAVKRLGEPVIRAAVKQAMRELGAQFVLGQTIEAAMKRAAAQEELGFTYSYDMLGEAALTREDADTYFQRYCDAISAISAACTHDSVRQNPGISIKLSALHPRYEVAQAERVMAELGPRVIDLALRARAAGMGLNIDAEEARRLDLSLDLIEAVMADSRLAGWDGLGIVVQAYGKRAGPLIDWLYALAEAHDRQIMVRLVKGAYWDSEIKLAQVEGVPDFPVFTAKPATDVSYICCAKKLLGMTDRIYPQFATHNAHTISAILELAPSKSMFEFQRLHGMGEALHKMVMAREGTACRNYAPVGVHKDLLAYLVRRLLENGANSSFVNQIVDEDVPPAVIAADPFEQVDDAITTLMPGLRRPADLFAPDRINSRGFDLSNIDDRSALDQAREPFAQTVWHVDGHSGHLLHEVRNPARPDELVGWTYELTAEETRACIDKARPWNDADTDRRAAILRRGAELYEQNFGEIFAALSREAGKSQPDSIAELREAVDFLRYYAAEAERGLSGEPCGLFACISPWNFPLAIFTGQLAAALAAGNGVLAKPAESTPIIASIAVRLLHEAGVPEAVLQLVPGRGSVVGTALTSDPRISGVCFTGSTATAQRINRKMAEHVSPSARLIAETGGINAMVVDSTALPEQAVRDIVASAFQSAGQRCSALRVLYLQEDIAPAFQKMLFGAMDELRIGDPWNLTTDIGPVISPDARRGIDAHIDRARKDGRVLKELPRPGDGLFVGPTAIAVKDIEDLEQEIFGPVLHIATFKAKDINKVADAINASGYGLTFGLHTRIDDRVEALTQRLRVGNAYVNRNQIGAIVGSQPFGGEGLSGTGPKAGGPHYLERFRREPGVVTDHVITAPALPLERVQGAIDASPLPSGERLTVADLPGPTGESNRLSLYPRGRVLCLGPGADFARLQAEQARSQGCTAVLVAAGLGRDEGLAGEVEPATLGALTGIDVVAFWDDDDRARAFRIALAGRDGPLVPLVTADDLTAYCVLERHICIDTTAAGGNASLLAGSAGSDVEGHALGER